MKSFNYYLYYFLGINNIMKLYIKTTLLLYTFFYLCICFVGFEIYNPFKWIYDIPKYCGEGRFWILFIFCLYHFLFGWYISESKTKN